MMYSAQKLKQGDNIQPWCTPFPIWNQSVVRRLYTWTSPDGQHRNQIDHILCSLKWRSCIQSAKTRPGADSGSDHELITKFRIKLKKVGKTARPFRYDLNQIPYDYAVEMRNRFKGLELIDRVPEELWTEIPDIVQEIDRDQDHPHGKEMQKSNMAVWGGLTSSCEKKTCFHSTEITQGPKGKS